MYVTNLLHYSVMIHLYRGLINKRMVMNKRLLSKHDVGEFMH